MNKDAFIEMCHNIYDPIHGKELVKKIFYPIKESELIILIKIYNNEFKYFDKGIQSAKYATTRGDLFFLCVY